jgi:hypothetical protein
MRVFSLEKSGFSTPGKPDTIERLSCVLVVPQMAQSVKALSPTAGWEAAGSPSLRRLNLFPLGN